MIRLRCVFLARVAHKWCVLLSAFWDSQCQYVLVMFIYLHQLVKVVSAGCLYWKAIFFLFVVINILGEIFWEEANPVSQTCLLILASISGSYLQQLILCFLPNGGSLSFSFLLCSLIGILLYGRAVHSPPFMYLFVNLYHGGLMDVYFMLCVII